MTPNPHAQYMAGLIQGFLKDRPEFIEYVRQRTIDPSLDHLCAEPDIKKDQLNPDAVIIKVMIADLTGSDNVYAVAVTDLVRERAVDMDEESIPLDIVRVSPCESRHNANAIYLVSEEYLVPLDQENLMSDILTAFDKQNWRAAFYLLYFIDDSEIHYRMGNYGETFLHLAVRSTNIPLFESLLHRVNDYTAYLCSRSYGNNILHDIVASNSYPLLQSLIKIRPTQMHKLANQQDNDGRVPLYQISNSCSSEMIQALLKPTDISNLTAGPRGRVSLLNVAIVTSNVRLVRALVNNPESVSKLVRNDNSYLPLHLAVTLNKSEILSILYDKATPEQVSYQTNDGHTALHLAAMKGDMGMTSILLRDPIKAKVLVHIIDAEGMTALQRAKENGPDTFDLITATIKSFMQS